MRPRSVAVVGGGITGLTAAWSLLARAPETRVVLYEASDRLGGKVHTVDFAGGQVEAGPDSFVTRDPAVEQLLADLGLGAALTEPAVFAGAIWADGRARSFPSDSFWGLPVGVRVALSAQALSYKGRARALADLVALRPLRGPDVSVGHFLGRRFGGEVVKRLVDPLLAGTRSGEVATMSLAAGLPQVDAIARSHRSVMRGVMSERRKGSAAGPPKFKTVAGGMSRIVDALARSVEERADIVPGSRVSSLRSADSGFEVVLGSGATEKVEGVILCAPAPAAAELVRPLSTDAASALATIEYAPVCSVALAYPRGTVAEPPGTSGILVPRGAGRTISACTWWTTKWPASMPDHQIVRCFVGRAPGDAIPQEDEILVAACARDVNAVTGCSVDPVDYDVTRWSEGLPQYRVGHLEKVARIESDLARYPGLALAGASYRGSGLPDCITQAHAAVVRVMAGPRSA